jgi:hypothetical protein
VIKTPADTPGGPVTGSQVVPYDSGETGLCGRPRLPAIGLVAVAVANQAAKDGAAAKLDDPVQAVQQAMWQAACPPLQVCR